MRIAIVTVVSVLMIFLAACNDREVLKPIDPNEQITLRILSGYYDQNLYEERLGKFFEFDYPNIKVELLALNEIFPDKLEADKVEQILAENDIDLIVMNDRQYERLSEFDLLYSVEAIANAEIETEVLLDQALAFLREQLGNLSNSSTARK